MLSAKKVSVERDKHLLVSGPAAVTLVKGKARMLGREIREGEIVVVPKWRTFCFTAKEDCEFLVSLSQDATFSVEKENVVSVWEREIEKYIEEDKRILVAGPTDSGKSSITTMIINMALGKGIRPRVIDTDIGQSNVCTPTMMCAAEPNQPIHFLREVRADIRRFVGSITPAVLTERAIAAASSLLPKRGFVVIDSDGWVEGVGAFNYKRALLRALEPDVVIYMGKAPKWAKGHWELVELPRPEARQRSREDRRMIRHRKYEEELKDCKTRDISLDVPVFGSCLLSGERIDMEGALYASKCGDEIYLLTDLKCPNCIRPGSERGLLVGLTDERGNDHLGMVVRFDPKKEVLKIKTCYEGEVTAITFGRVRLDENWRDSLVKERCPF